MVKVKSIKIDGEEIHVFNSAIYIFEGSTGLSLELNLIVSEIVVNKYKQVENVIIEIELEDGRIVNSIMYVKTLKGRLPQLHLFCDIDDIHEYEDVDLVNENDAWLPNIEEGITLEDIRKVEMPIEDIILKLKLPIDQVEWLKMQKKRDLNQLISEYIYSKWKSKDME